MAAHSSTLAWKIAWTEEPGRVQSMESLRVRHDWVTSLPLFTFMHWRRKWQPTPVFLPGESQGRGAWWAAVYGVAQSQTRLKGLSSSSGRIIQSGFSSVQSVQSLSHVRLLAASWTAPYQAPPSMGFARQEYWSGVPLPSPWTALGVPNNSYLESQLGKGPWLCIHPMGETSNCSFRGSCL